MMSTNLIAFLQNLPGRHYMHPSGVRIGVPETTRLGMKEGEMKEIASFIRRVVVDRQDPSVVAKDVAESKAGACEVAQMA